MWMLNMTTICTTLGIYLFKTLSMQKENKKKPPEYNSLSSIRLMVSSPTAQIYAFFGV